MGRVIKNVRVLSARPGNPRWVDVQIAKWIPGWLALWIAMSAASLKIEELYGTLYDSFDPKVMEGSPTAVNGNRLYRLEFKESA